MPPDWRLAARGRTGSQMPRVLVVPPGVVETDGPDAVELCSEYWFALDEWQRDILDSWLARDERGRLLCITAGLSVPRQNGKNGVVEALEFYLLCSDTEGTTHILHTAHQRKTAKRAFDRMVKALTAPGRGRKAIRDLVEKIRYTNGEEAIYLKGGASIEYMSRSRGAARGYEGITLVVFDEAQELTDEQLEALMPTLAASPTGERQIIYTGTPPGPTCPGTVFRRRRDAAASGSAPRTSWHEWSIAELPPRDATFADVVDAVFATNPSMELDRPSSLSLDFTEAEFSDMGVDGFARERLGWWAPVAERAAAIPKDKWDALAVAGASRNKRRVLALGVKFSPDGDWAAVSVGVRAPKRKLHVELVRFDRIAETGVEPLARWIHQRRDRLAMVMVDGRSNADALCERLGALGYPRRGYARASTRDVAAASSMLVDLVREGGVTHKAGGQDALDQSVATSPKRYIGSTGAFGFGGECPEPVESAALAAMAAQTTRRRPGRRSTIL